MKTLLNQITSIYNELHTNILTSMNKLKILLNSDNDIVSDTIKKTNFYEFYLKWYNEYKKPILKESSLENIRQIANKHILPILRDKNIEDITTEELNTLFKQFSSKITRTKTITYNTLNNLFKYALNQEILKNNPLEKVYIKKNNGNKKRAFTLEEQKALEKYLKDNYTIYNNYFLFILNTGCRRQEALDIRKKDIDLQNMVLSIPGTKTNTSNRKMPLNKYLLDLLGNEEIPFPFKANAVQHNFKKIMNKLKFQDLTIHSLRHTFATRALEKGINSKVVQKWLGHTSIKTTLDIYSDIQTEFEKEQFNKLFKEI